MPKKVTVPKKDVIACNAKLSKIGKIIDAQMMYVNKNKAPNYVLFEIQSNLIDAYEPKCNSFESVVDKAIKDVSKTIKSTCIPLPSADEIVKCVENVERKNPIIFFQDTQEAFAVDQMKKAQEEAFLKLGMAMKGGSGEDDEKVPQEAINRDLWKAMFV
jgi:hypothetical protein